jgi:hypothetical protein
MIAYYLALRVYHKLSEVPGDLLCLLFHWIVELRVSSEVLVDSACIRSIHISLCEHGEFGAIELSSECFDLSIATWLLAGELVAGEG